MLNVIAIILFGVVFGLHSFVVSLLCIVLTLAAITYIGTPPGMLTINRNIRRIDLCNSAGETPLLLANLPHADNPRISCLTFYNVGTPHQEWQDKAAKIQAALDRYVLRIEESASLHRMLVHTVPVSGGLPTLLPWFPHFASDDGFVLVLGEHLAAQIARSSEFPHEIGLFLGYPLADVRGFIEHRGQNSKCTGCWKVYSDEQMAQYLFMRFQKCTEIYCRKLEEGTSILRLTVAA